MVNVKVLGTGCANCRTTIKLLESVAQGAGVAIELEKVEDVRAIRPMVSCPRRVW